MSPLKNALEKLPAAEINFNYLGRLDPQAHESREFARVNEPAGPVQPGTAMRRYLLTINGQILNDQLKLNFTYSANLHTKQTMEALASSFVGYLQALIASCRRSPYGLRPGDFPNARVTQKDLDKVLARIGKLSNASGS
jgi:non-ribosomal peptide synthase protein (TIGR01720 family)